MNKALAPAKVCDIRLGQNVRFDAWLYSMLMDNNLAYRMNPDIIASPEQMAFMVHMDQDQVYLPCSDATFSMLCAGTPSAELRNQYNRSWRIIARLVRSFVPDKAQQRRILQFCRYRFSQYIAQHTLIPSRLVKRMTSLVLAQGHMTDDPWEERRRESTGSQQEMLALPEIHENLEAMPGGSMPKGISIARRSMDYVEMARLLCLSAMSRDWLEKNLLAGKCAGLWKKPRQTVKACACILRPMPDVRVQCCFYAMLTAACCSTLLWHKALSAWGTGSFSR